MEAFKLFNKWDMQVEYRDAGLKDYINLKPTLNLSSGGRHVKTQFWKAKCNLIERLMNRMMVTGHLKEGRVHKRISGRDTGKKTTEYKLVKKALEMIEEKTKQNPLQVLVQAIENAAPKEETTSFRQGGIIARKPVDVSPQRRLDLSLRLISHGAAQRAFKVKKSVSETLADEIIAASKYDVKTYSISKREETERVASGSR